MPVIHTLQALSALGVLLAVVPTGFLLLRRVEGIVDPAAPSWNWILAAPVGVAVWSLPLVVAAQVGSFRPDLLGAAGWLVTVSAFSRRGNWSWRPEWLSWPKGLAWASVALIAWLYAAFPNETLLGNRDEGLYTLMALLLQRTGGLAIEAPSATAAATAAAMYRPFVDGQVFHLPGVYATGEGLRLQFSPLLPAWIAQVATATAGFGLFRASALFALAAVVVFHALARRFVASGPALLATIVFALCPAHVWIARINLVEPLARLLVLGGLLAAVVAVERGARGLAVLAGLLFGAAAFGRLDMVMLAPATIAALAATRLWPSPRLERSAGALGALAAATTAAQCVAVALLAWSTPGYLRDNSGPVVAAGVAAFAGLAMLPLCGARALDVVRTPSARRLLGGATVLVLLLLLAYAALLRPYLEPYALIARPDHLLDGTRDYRERSLVNLAAYLGWPVVVAAALGSALALCRVLHGRAHAALLLIAMISVPAACVMLASPRVSPDHFWAVRRFVVLVIPGFALLAAYAVQALLVRLRLRGPRTIAVALAVVVALSMVAAQRHTLFVRENHGLAAQLVELDRAIGRSSLLVTRDLDALATTLAVGFGRQVMPLREVAAKVDPSAREFWSICTPADPCHLLHLDHRGLAGLALGSGRPVRVERRFIRPTALPLPVETSVETTAFFVTPVLGLDSQGPGTLVGAYRDWRVGESGLYIEDLLPSLSGRWTGSEATLRIPRIDADTLELRFVVPGKGLRAIAILIDGVVVHRGPLVGEQRLVHRLPPAPLSRATRELRIEAQAFNPRAAGDGPDARDLGVWIGAVRQYDSAAPRLESRAADTAYSSRVEVAGGPYTAPVEIGAGAAPARVTMAVTNSGGTVFPGGAEVNANEIPVALGIAWRRFGGGAVVHQQRVGLPFALRPGERILMTPEFEPPRAGDGSLAVGDYELEIDLVQDGVAWFASRGGVPAKLRINVTSPARRGL